jgi:D-glycero-alpha-D-manno-heptose 1-phosphate guanylyltransferase
MDEGLKLGNQSSPVVKQIKQAIILAGGLGTRLRNVVPDLPKSMAPVAKRPFLSFVIDALRIQGIEQFIFSLGYKADVVEKYLEEHYPTLDYSIVVEEEPLGTGGAIQLACTKTNEENVLVANGDTLFKIKLNELESFHIHHKAECTIALKHLEKFDRYGVVEINEEDSVIAFKEKQSYSKGLINGGIYILNVPRFLQHSFPEKFSFEKEYLEENVGNSNLYGCIQDGYFIDIGVPQDFNKAQEDLLLSPKDLKSVDKGWTLFLDRDGVINKERSGEYVLNWNEFVFSEGTLDALKILATRFERIILVTNQRGIGRELMTHDDLKIIHNEMQKEIFAAGGRIDQIYYCGEIDSKSFHRKPNPGMALQASKDFTEIDFSKSIMVGNKPSDMRFGRSVGMVTVFITSTNPSQPFPHPDIDVCFSSLLEFARSIES